MAEVIDRFAGPWRFLSNFFLESSDGKTVEHHFQAAKTYSAAERRWILAAPTAQAAKARGRAIVLRPDWEDVKIGVMADLVRFKFTDDEHLQRLLLSTEEALLIEGNSWGDRFWGQVNGQGENWLGRVLMDVRTEIRAANTPRVHHEATGLKCSQCGARFDPHDHTEGFLCDECGPKPS